MEYVRCVWLGVAYVERGVSVLGLVFTTPGGTGRVLDVCWGCGGVGGEWVGGLDHRV